jgi:hypothetical protein
MLKAVARIAVLNFFLGSLLFSASSVATSAEVSLINGFYKSEKVTDGLETTVIQLGGRYTDYLSARMAWFANVTLALKTYSASANEPESMNDIELGGGAKQFFPRLSEKLTPYVSAGASYKTLSGQPSWSSASTSWSEESGIYYRGDLGLRLNFDENAFIELETNIFNSALTAKEKRVVKTPTSKNESTVDRVELFVDSVGSFNNVTISAGMKI